MSEPDCIVQYYYITSNFLVSIVSKYSKRSGLGSVTFSSIHGNSSGSNTKIVSLTLGISEKLAPVFEF